MPSDRGRPAAVSFGRRYYWAAWARSGLLLEGGKAVPFRVRVGERDGGGGQRDTGRRGRRRDDTVGGAVRILPERAGRRLGALSDHRDRDLLLLPLHRRLNADVADAGDDDVRMLV